MSHKGRQQTDKIRTGPTHRVDPSGGREGSGVGGWKAPPHIAWGYHSTPQSLRRLECQSPHRPLPSPRNQRVLYYSSGGAHVKPNRIMERCQEKNDSSFGSACSDNDVDRTRAPGFGAHGCWWVGVEGVLKPPPTISQGPNCAQLKLRTSCGPRNHGPQKRAPSKQGHSGSITEVGSK